MDGLRVMSVTGAVVTAGVFEWTMKAFGRHVHVVSTSGGTDICASCGSRPHFFSCLVLMVNSCDWDGELACVRWRDPGEVVGNEGRGI